MKYMIAMLCMIMLVGCGEKTIPDDPQPLSLEEKGETKEVSGSGLIQEEKEQDALLPPLIKGDWGGFITQNNEPDVLLSPWQGGIEGGSDWVQLSPNTLSTHTNHLISLQTDAPEDILYVTIWGYSYKLSEHEGNKYFEIQKNTFSPGDYFISVQNNAWDIIGLEQKMTILWGQDYGINLINITPDTISNTKKTSIVLQWNGFSKVISVQLDNNIILKETNFDIITDQVMSIEIPQWIPVGRYNFNLLTTEKIVKLPSHALTIQ